MLNGWPNVETLETMKIVPHMRLEAEAAKSGQRTVHSMEVPTFAGNFGLGATAFGVSLVFFPGVKDCDVQHRMKKHGMESGPLGEQRAIEAGLELMSYFLGGLEHFTVPVDFSFVTPFQRDIFTALTSIPFGETITYGELAHLAGHPGAARAVGSAMRCNPAPIFVPCHRVVSASGLGGWSGPKGWKEWLLEHEGIR
ncbi:MAG: methylated-DNA--[protein]-cysteine S-methyltransferase [Deltaproteobacteria bacterium]|nr:methylated-DNA--[protein]-cysteine S-methyltransferase [Deltaproteobacteria bacterium]